MTFTVFRWLRQTYHAARYRRIASLLEDTSTTSLLDVGCGRPCESMQDCAFLSFIGYGVGLDVAPCHCSHPHVRASVLAPPFKTACFSVITALEVLEHVDDADDALDEISNALQSKGVFILSIPTTHLFWRVFWHLWTRSVGRYWKDTHQTTLAVHDWEKKLTRHFSIESTTSVWGVNNIIVARKKQ